MGSGPSNDNSQETSTNSYQLGQELHDNAQAVGIIGDGNEVIVTDHNAVSGAFEFGKSVLEQATGSVNNSLAEIRKNNEQALDFARQVGNSEQSQIADSLVKALPLIVVVGGIAYVFKKG